MNESVLPSAEGGVERLSEIDEAQTFSRALQPNSSKTILSSQTVEVSGIERWEHLLDDLDAVELIGRYTSLTRTEEASYGIKGHCPLCRHGVDSLLVDGRADSYFCTECLAGGHALDFYARIEGLSLSESVRRVKGLLASGQLQGKRPRLEKLRRIVQETHRFAYEALSYSREGKSALAWLGRQGVTAETAEGFSLGVLSCALGGQLRERLFTMGLGNDELEQAGVDGWISCMEDRVRDGEPDLVILMPVCYAEGQGCGFYEQSIGEAADVMWSSCFLPYGYQLLSPHRADRLLFSASNDFTSSVVLAERPWDVVLLTQGGMEEAVYVSPLDTGEYSDRLDKFLMRTRKTIWPIHQSELNVEFLRHLFSLSGESLGRLAFVVLSEGERLPELLRREGLAAVQARLAGAVPPNELLGCDVLPVEKDH